MAQQLSIVSIALFKTTLSRFEAGAPFELSSQSQTVMLTKINHVIPQPEKGHNRETKTSDVCFPSYISARYLLHFTELRYFNLLAASLCLLQARIVWMHSVDS